jgi:hypothetical protein
MFTNIEEEHWQARVANDNYTDSCLTPLRHRYVLLFHSVAAQVGQGLLITEASLSHSDTPHSQRPLPDNIQQSQETDFHSLGGIRTRNPSKPAAADRAATGIGGMYVYHMI